MMPQYNEDLSCFSEMISFGKNVSSMLEPVTESILLKDQEALSNSPTKGPPSGGSNGSGSVGTGHRAVLELLDGEKSSSEMYKIFEEV